MLQLSPDATANQKLKTASQLLLVAPEAPMKPEESIPASAKEPDVSPDCNPPGKCDDDPFRSKIDLDGKTDSGPEPDVFGREIPPQD